MAGLSTLLFDVDGTLAETEETHREAFNRSFAAAGLDWVWSKPLYAELLAVAGGKERIRFYLQRYRPELVASMAQGDIIADLHAGKTRFYTSMVESGEVALRPGVKRLLDAALNDGLRLAIATTTTPANVAALLRASLAPDAESWFEVIGAGGMVPSKKPAPDIYLYVMDKMKVAAGDCLALEDSANGLRAARAARLTTLVTVSEYTHDERFDGAALVLDHLGEPDLPFRVLAGDAGQQRYVTTELLRELHARGVKARRS
jgi:HAD superfamily hydrolase (TIGR01509 family)